MMTPTLTFTVFAWIVVLIFSALLAGRISEVKNAAWRAAHIASTPSDRRAVKNNISIINRVIKEARS